MRRSRRADTADIPRVHPMPHATNLRSRATFTSLSRALPSLVCAPGAWIGT
jgi:hypothetical protein